MSSQNTSVLEMVKSSCSPVAQGLQLHLGRPSGKTCTLTLNYHVTHGHLLDGREFIVIQRGLHRYKALLPLKSFIAQWPLQRDSEEGCLHEVPFQKGLGSYISKMAKHEALYFVPPETLT